MIDSTARPVLYTTRTMPLVTLVGLPASGKTRLAGLLEAHFKSLDLQTQLINEEALSIDKEEGYKSNFVVAFCPAPPRPPDKNNSLRL